MSSEFAINNAWMQVVDEAGTRRWAEFKNSTQSIVVSKPSEVISGLEQVEQAQSDGLWAVGYITYEASSGLDPALLTHLPQQPVLSFAIFDSPTYKDLPKIHDLISDCQLNQSISELEHQQGVAKIKEHIRSGDTYQVNYTYPMTGLADFDPFSYFKLLNYNQRSPYSAFIDSKRLAICSASPELFFARHDHKMSMKPMKGTRPRSNNAAKDNEMLNDLKASEKDLAENLMICDMVRNDLARIANLGSITATDIGHVESYPTVHQMTASVTATTNASFSQVIEATFPASSITGAPKYSTMKIISELEKGPRGIYTGAIGWLAPHGRSEFSVSIRTAVIDKLNKTNTYGVGGGIVIDSIASDEYNETLTKAKVAEVDQVSVFETILWDKTCGYTLLGLHINRLLRSCKQLGIETTEAELRNEVDELGKSLGEESLVVRIDVDINANISTIVRPLPELADNPKIGVDFRPVSPDLFLSNKTSQRLRYNEAKLLHPDLYETLLIDTEGFITEGTFSNVVAKFDGRYVTPKANGALLPGTLRQTLVQSGLVSEQNFTAVDLTKASEIYMVNSVRGWTKVSYE